MPCQDLSDIGNLIGFALGRNKIENKAENGNDLSELEFGIKQGMNVILDEKEKQMDILEYSDIIIAIKSKIGRLSTDMKVLVKNRGKL
jgi:hypothetical protein